MTETENLPPGGALVTVLIALRNDSRGLVATLESIAGQRDADSVRILVVDCNSVDFPVDVVRQFSDRLALDFHAGHDRGIYHSWNRGLRWVQTPWVTFFGAGDLFVDGAIARIVAAARSPDAADVISAKSENLYPRGLREIRGEPFDAARFGRFFTINHSGTIYRTTLFADYGNFDEGYRSSGDYDFLMRIRNRARFGFIDTVVSQYIVGGISSSSLRPLKESYRVRERHKTVSRWQNRAIFIRSLLAFYRLRFFR
jgi:glycosyltransferase involved in cell wall biosynthesis